MMYSRHFILLLLIFLAAGCENENEGELPETLPELRELEKEKRTSIRAMEKELRQIEEKIAAVDTASRQSRLPVATLDTLVRSDFYHFVEVQGTVQSRDNVAASPEMGGVIRNIFVQEGQLVKKGQVVAKVDDATLVSQKQEIETQLELARDLFERQQTLWKKEIGSEVQYLQAKNNKERLEKSLETIEVNLTKTIVRAPQSGIVDVLNLKEGEFAGPGVPIMRIIDNQRLKVVMEVPENYLGSVALGDRIKVKFPSIEVEREAQVSLIGNSINRNNRTFSVEAHIQLDEKGLIRPNMLATAMINDYVRKDVIQIPINLVQQEVSGDSYVFVKGITEEGPVAVKRKLRLGEVYQGEVVVEEGLEEGQLILVDGSRKLRDGEQFALK